MGTMATGDIGAHHRLMAIAAGYSAAGNGLVAGLAFERAIHAAWGDPSRMAEAFRSAMDCYAGVYAREDRCSFAGLAALVKMIKLTWQSYLAPSAQEDLDRVSSTEELAQLIVSCLGTSADAESYLVRGVELQIASNGAVTANFTPYEVDMAVERGSLRDGWIVGVPAAFGLFVRQADYGAARTIACDFASAFRSPALRGWRSAVLGFTDPDGAASHFRDASAAFAEDVPSTGELPGQDGAPYWTGINSQLWSPYFAARAHIAEIRTAPDRATELVASAAAAYKFNEVGWMNARAVAFGVLIASLNQLLTAGSSSEVRRIQEQFKREIRAFASSPESDLVEQFAILAADSFEGFLRNPEIEVTTGNLPAALELLKRIPLLDEGVANAVVPALGRKAFSEALGAQQTWIYRTLESIKDERTLQRIVLRLIQSSSPSYAQILHGPLEYGKDIVVVVRSDNQVILRMYQLKIGDITTAVWTDARRELEDMFLVPVSDFQLRDAPDTREGILLCNGHCNPYVQPVMDAWYREQERDHRRQIRFEHLDDLVGWITRERLISELRAALEEYGVPII